MIPKTEEKYLNGTISAASLKGKLNTEMRIGGGLSIPKTSTTKDYNTLTNKPKIESVELVGNKSMSELGVETLSNSEIEAILNNFN